MICKQWFPSARSEGIKYARFFKDIPIPIIALVVSAVSFCLCLMNSDIKLLKVENSIQEYSTGALLIYSVSHGFILPTFTSDYLHSGAGKLFILQDGSEDDLEGVDFDVLETSG